MPDTRFQREFGSAAPGGVRQPGPHHRQRLTGACLAEDYCAQQGASSVSPFADAGRPVRPDVTLSRTPAGLAEAERTCSLGARES